MCHETGIGGEKENEFLCIETTVGKWRINTNTSPIKIEHINLVQTPCIKMYHEQPRRFLSFIDTFNYIKRHDDELIKKTKEGRMFLNFIPIR